MIHRHLIAWAAAPPLICCLALPAALAAMPAATLLKPAAPRSAPASPDNRLTETLAKCRGKPVLVNFWATWCEPCREEMPALGRLAARWQTRDLAVVTVAVADNVKAVDDFLWEALPEKQTLLVLHDREQTISRAWSARMLPTTVVLDRQHRIVARARGVVDWDAPATDQQLKKLIN